MQNLSLYNAAETVRHLLEQIDPETGELPPEYEQARALVATKAQACAAFVLANDAEAASAATLIDQITSANVKASASARRR